jgi:hypothetical protein
MLGLILAVAVWQIFRTGQTAIRKESRETNVRRRNECPAGGR